MDNEEFTADNYTNVFRTRRMLHGIQDIAFPVPIPVDAILITLGFTIPWGLILGFVIGYGIFDAGAMSIIVWLAPPAGVGWIMTQANFDNRPFVDYLKAQIAYYSSRGGWSDLKQRDSYEKFGYVVSVRYWEFLARQSKAKEEKQQKKKRRRK